VISWSHNDFLSQHGI